jgi:uncharacterized membrane protein YeaQ/YmgE (transglycosylase-associated protein family)
VGGTDSGRRAGLPGVPGARKQGEKMGIMGIIWMIVVGFVVGLLARFFFPGPVPLGFWLTSLLGIGGSIVGGLIGGMIWRSSDGKFHPAGIVMSILGAMLLLWGYLSFVK